MTLLHQLGDLFSGECLTRYLSGSELFNLAECGSRDLNYTLSRAPVTLLFTEWKPIFVRPAHVLLRRIHHYFPNVTSVSFDFGSSFPEPIIKLIDLKLPALKLSMLGYPWYKAEKAGYNPLLGVHFRKLYHISIVEYDGTIIGENIGSLFTFCGHAISQVFPKLHTFILRCESMRGLYDFVPFIPLNVSNLCIEGEHQKTGNDEGYQPSTGLDLTRYIYDMDIDTSSQPLRAVSSLTLCFGNSISGVNIAYLNRTYEMSLLTTLSLDISETFNAALLPPTIEVLTIRRYIQTDSIKVSLDQLPSGLTSLDLIGHLEVDLHQILPNNMKRFWCSNLAILIDHGDFMTLPQLPRTIEKMSFYITRDDKLTPHDKVVANDKLVPHDVHILSSVLDHQYDPSYLTTHWPRNLQLGIVTPQAKHILNVLGWKADGDPITITSYQMFIMTFNGSGVRLVSGDLYPTVRSDDDKEFHHNIKIDVRNLPCEIEVINSDIKTVRITLSHYYQDNSHQSLDLLLPSLMRALPNSVVKLTIYTILYSVEEVEKIIKSIKDQPHLSGLILSTTTKTKKGMCTSSVYCHGVDI